MHYFQACLPILNIIVYYDKIFFNFVIIIICFPLAICNNSYTNKCK